MKVDNYGEMIAKAIDGLLWSYEQYGDYQGDYIALIYKDGNLLIYKGAYGSCSGCDWLCDYSDGEVPDEAAKDYVKSEELYATIPVTDLPDNINDLKTLLPANSRLWQDEEYHFKLHDVLEQIKNPQPGADNLSIVEMEAARKGLL